VHRLSLLIVTFNRPDELLDLLENVAGQQRASELLAETLILDNGTTADYSKVWDFANRHDELRIQVIRSERNLGAAPGKRLLMERASSDLLLIVDDDMVFSSANDLESLAAVFEKEPFQKANAAIVQARVVYHDTKALQRSAFPHKRRQPDADSEPFLTSFFAGGAHVIKREALDKVGLYPDDFFYGMEEYDLGYRVIGAGYSIGYDPSITVEHKESQQGRLADHAKLRLQWVNKTRVAWRYLPLQYFLTTAVLWSFEYVRQVRGHPKDYFGGWRDVLRIPFTEKRTVLGAPSLAYLESVDARLWY
jgi:GT2 family glycosyltransferase